MDDDLHIHPERLSEKPDVREGSFRPGALERLEDSLASGEGELRYRIRAFLDPQRRPIVSCIIEGFVFLTCQTTLEAFRHDISIDDRLVLVPDEAGLPAIEEESETEDYLVADGPLDIRDLIEDAVLLALPMVPRKPGLGEDAGGLREAGDKDSPFAALAGLRRKQ